MDPHRAGALLLVPVTLFLAGCGGGGGGGGGEAPAGAMPAFCASQTPVQVSPADGAEIGNAGIPHQWLNFVYDASECQPPYFEAQHSTSSDFSSDVDQDEIPLGSGSEFYGAYPLQPGTTYYWRVRAAWDDAAAAWSPVWSFHTIDVCDASDLAAPWPIDPENGAGTEAILPGFHWSYPDVACSPEGYHFQVSASEDFSSTLIDQRDPTPFEHAYPNVAFEPCTLLYWRVAAYRGETDGPWSETQSYWVEPDEGCSLACAAASLVEPEPVAPSLYENVGMAPVQGLAPHLLQWSYPAPCQPEGYAVLLSDEPEFVNNFWGANTGSPIPSWTPYLPLNPATQYWWEAAGMVGTDVGPYSNRMTFFTGPECDSSGQLDIPTLLSPSDGASVGTLHPRLRFTIGADGCVPDGYYVDVQTDPDFGGENVLGLDPTQHILTTNVYAHSLAWCATYYWRVAAVEGDVQGEFSETWSFTPLSAVECTGNAPLVVGLQEAACYYGPGAAFQILGYLLEGESAPLFGRDMSGLWLAIDNPDNPGQRCWLERRFVDVAGEEEGLRILNPPPACRAELSQSDCTAAGGTWTQTHDVSGAPQSFCQCP